MPYNGGMGMPTVDLKGSIFTMFYCLEYTAAMSNPNPPSFSGGFYNTGAAGAVFEHFTPVMYYEVSYGWGGGSPPGDYTIGGAAPANVLYVLVHSYNSSTHESKVQGIDGNLVKFTQDLNTQMALTTGRWSLNGIVTNIGTLGYSTYGAHFYEIRYYDRAFSDAEISSTVSTLLTKWAL